MYEPIHAPVGGLADFPLMLSICVNAERSGNAETHIWLGDQCLD